LQRQAKLFLAILYAGLNTEINPQQPRNQLKKQEKTALSGCRPVQTLLRNLTKS
jgi:hypothetical protein